MTIILRNTVWKATHKLCQFLFSSPTLVLKSGGNVLAPVRRLTRKAFQFEYLCCMPARRKHKDGQRQKPGSWTQRWDQPDLLFGGTRGLPLEAHQPTGCTSGIHRLHQKSLLVSLSKPSYLRRALNPATQKQTDQRPQDHKQNDFVSPSVKVLEH